MKKFVRSIITTIIIVFSILVLPISDIHSSALTEIEKDKDIVEIAVKDGKFNTLVEALTKANLVNTLKGEGPFTVFAPTDDAFKKLPAGTLENLLKPENNETLKDILLYHVTKGKLSSVDISRLDGKKINLENNKTANISVKNGYVYINDSKIIITDINASNGVIHVIDTVLMPK